jgi:aryl-alcohol dehydrogenase-like predicted oxidoreductase
MVNNRLVLGTAQLGMNYGIANKTGEPDLEAARDIVLTAWNGGIRYFDTAQAYGNSELVLGEILADLGIVKQAHIITKLAPNVNHGNKKDVEDALRKSLDNLQCDCLYGLMLHREEMLSFWHNGLADILLKLFKKGMFQKVGVSVYTPSKAIEAISTEGIDMVQIPTNILDRRFVNAGVSELARTKKKDVYIRSVFLQGLLLMHSRDLPIKMSFAVPVLEKLENLSKEFGLTRHEIAFGYIKSKMPNAKVVFGVETKEQITENFVAWKKDFPAILSEQIGISFPNVSERILNPSLW